MVSKANSIEVKKYSQGLAIETNNFAFEVKVILGLLTIETNNFVFEVKVILGLESTCQDGQEAKIVKWLPWPIVLNGTHD